MVGGGWLAGRTDRGVPFADEETAVGCCFRGEATDLTADLKGLEGEATSGEAAIL